jgi:hypothetical protein
MNPLRILIIILTALWLHACAHTSPPDQSKPEMKKPAENTSENRTPPSDQAESKQQESGDNSQTGQPPSQNESGINRQESRKKEQASQSPAEPVTKPKPDEPTENTDKTRPTSVDSANAKLAKARENLKTSQETEKRIASDLEHLKQSGDASPEAIGDYEEYLARVQAMTAENRKIVAQMEAVYDQHTHSESNPNSPAPNKSDNTYDPNFPDDQAVDEVAALDKEFNESLAKFDDKLLKEMDEIRAESAKKLKDLAQEAADAAKRLRAKGLEVDSSGSESSQGPDGQKETSEGGRETGTTKDTTDTETASRDGSRKGGEGSSAGDRGRTDTEDDDIVARQLREAAENETDPELKEKLWKEYEEYKKSR